MSEGCLDYGADDLDEEFRLIRRSSGKDKNCFRIRVNFDYLKVQN